MEQTICEFMKVTLSPFRPDDHHEHQHHHRAIVSCRVQTGTQWQRARSKNAGEMCERLWNNSLIQVCLHPYRVPHRSDADAHETLSARRRTLAPALESCINFSAPISNFGS